MIGDAAVLPGWVWFGAAAVLCAAFAMWRGRSRGRARSNGPGGEDDGWRTVDNLAIGGTALALVLMIVGVVVDVADIDLTRLLGSRLR